METTRLIIAGSRSFGHQAYSDVEEAVEDSGFEFDLIVSGGARGVDELGERYGKENAIPVHIIPADWDQYGKRAGVIRNEQMADYADKLIAIWDGDSSGTNNMIIEAHKRDMPIYVSMPHHNKIKTANYDYE